MTAAAAPTVPADTISGQGLA
ncbi:MAG: hypothetical protein QOI92_1123, partial [Chloroflexota bacterium]|nr:hypothetical protein [Chloroflexota bacterium]